MERRRFYPTEEDPRYGGVIQVVAIQFETIDRTFTDWMDVEESDLISVGKCWSEWKKTKQRISDELCNILNKMVRTPFKDAVALKVHYWGDKPGNYQIL